MCGPMLHDFIRTAAISAGLIGLPRALISDDDMHKSIPASASHVAGDSSTPADHPSSMRDSLKRAGAAAVHEGEGGR